MTADSTHQALREIQALYALGPTGGMTDAQLVAQFVDRGDGAEAAFAALVERHGPMVLGVCRRMLGADGSGEADDAFQAVFLVLARRAGAIRRRDGLKAWLYGIAVRTAKEARRRSARRRAREGIAMDRARSRSVPDELRGEWLALLDEELNRLPERFRLPLVFCELEGASRKDAAQRLNLPEGTLSSRLARGRALLRDRLARRGVALGVGAMATLLPEPSIAAVPVGLADATVRLAFAYTAGGVAAGVVPASVASLADGVLTMISHARRTLSAIVAAAVVAAGLTTVWASSPWRGDQPEAAKPAKVAEKGAGDAAKPGDPEQTVRGIVVDEAGRPVAGVEVRFFAFSFRESTGVTGPDGTFAFPAHRMASDSLILLARDADGARLGLFRRGPSASRAEAEAPVRIVLKPGRDLVVRVAGPDGAPVAGAAVEAAHIAAATTDADGRATLRVPIDARVPWVYALKPGLGFDFAEFGPIDPGQFDRGAPAAELPATIDLALDGARTVRIHAVDAAGRPVAGVSFFPLSIQVDKRQSSAMVGGSQRALASTDADGVATYDWLPVGKSPISFVLVSDEFSTPLLRDGTETATTLTARLYRKGTIRGRATKPDGTPAAGIRVTAQGRGRGGYGTAGRARTGADGSYTMAVPSDVAYLVEVEDDDWAAPTREGIVIREGGPLAEADFRLERGTLIRGKVTVGPDRRPAPGLAIGIFERRGAVPADLTADPKPSPLQISRSMLTGPDGSYAFRVARGTYTLSLSGPERTPPAETIAVTDQAEVVRDFHRLRPERGPISGRVVLASDPGRGIAGAKVEVVASTDALGFAFAATSDADGRFHGERRLAPIVLRAASPDGSLAGLADADADAAEVVIPIGPTASASGQALDARGQPMANMPIDCDVERKPNYAHRNGHEATTDAFGRFTVARLVVGQPYRVSAETEPRRSEYLTTVIPREPGPLDMGTLQAGIIGSFRDDAPHTGALAPPIRGTALDGKPLAADDFRGKYVLLVFWGTWCGTYIDELPILKAVHDAFGNDPRFALVFLSVDGSIDAPRKFVAERKLPGLQGFIGPRVPGSVSDDFGVRGVPATILIGPDGKVIIKGMRGEAIKAAVARALGGMP